MVLSYYIATQIIEEQVKFLFIFFPPNWFCYFSWKNKMQHIPVVSHALLRGTFILKIVDMVPAMQTPGSYHRQDSCLFTVKSFIGQGSGHREVRGREAQVSHRFQQRRYFRGFVSSFSSPMGMTVLGAVDLCQLGQCIRESLEGGQANSGSSVHSAGRAKVVSHPLVATMVPPQSIYLSLYSFHPPRPIQFYQAKSPTDRWTQSKNFLS